MIKRDIRKRDRTLCCSSIYDSNKKIGVFANWYAKKRDTVQGVDLRRYLSEAETEELCKFVCTISASTILPKEVKVVSSNLAGINASTCALKLDIS